MITARGELRFVVFGPGFVSKLSLVFFSNLFYHLRGLKVDNFGAIGGICSLLFRGEIFISMGLPFKIEFKIFSRLRL